MEVQNNHNQFGWIIFSLFTFNDTQTLKAMYEGILNMRAVYLGHVVSDS